ncbi:hypothetical protein ScPMuIL_013726 [Solemya velum]
MNRRSRVIQDVTIRLASHYEGAVPEDRPEFSHWMPSNKNLTMGFLLPICGSLKSLSVLCFLSVALVLMLLRNTPYSKSFRIFNPGHNLKKASTLNMGRLSESSRYFDELEQRSEHFFPTHDIRSSDDLVIGIITTNRGNDIVELGYLTQTAAAMGKLIKSDSNNRNFQTKSFFLCNVDQKPEQHQEANYLKKFIPFTERYGNSSISINEESPHYMSSLFLDRLHNDTYEKELIDYMFCMHRALAMSRKFVMLVEDDTVPRPNMFTVLDHF